MKFFYLLLFVIILNLTYSQVRISYPAYLNKNTGIIEFGVVNCLFQKKPASCIKWDISYRLIKNNGYHNNFNFQIGYTRLHVLNPYYAIVPEINIGYSTLLKNEELNHGIIFSTILNVKLNSKLKPLLGYSYQSNEINQNKLRHCILVGFKYMFKN